MNCKISHQTHFFKHILIFSTFHIMASSGNDVRSNSVIMKSAVLSAKLTLGMSTEHKCRNTNLQINKKIYNK